MEHQYRFGPFRLDPDNARLWQGREEIVLRPKSFAVLGYLVARPGRLVSREELLQALWPGVTVSDAVLTVCIGEIRHALQDDRHTPHYIETLHRRGYRFLGTVIATPAVASASATTRIEPAPPGAIPAGPQSSALSPQSSARNSQSSALSFLSAAKPPSRNSWPGSARRKRDDGRLYSSQGKRGLARPPW
jgi:DNA-binding winged helix-turn-helix (wHTH) protein